MKQNKQNQTSLRRESLKTFELQKQLQKANQTIKRLQVQMKQVRKIAANEQIDLKLISQDQAAVLAKAQKQKNQIIKQFGDEIADLKGRLNADNKIWIQRFDIRKQQYLSEQKKIKEEAVKAINQNALRVEKQKNKLKEELEKQLKQKIILFEEQKKRKIQECDEKIRQMGNEWSRDKQRLVEEKENAVKDLEKKHEMDIKKMNKSHDLVVASVKSQKRSEENMHQETKSKMETQKKLLRDEIERLSGELVRANEEIVVLKNENGDLNTQLVEQIEKNRLSNEQWIKRLEEQQSSHQKYISELGNKYQENATTLLKSHFQHIEKLELNLTVLKTKNDEQKSLHNTQIEQIKQIYQQRPSRQQDLMSLNQVEQKLYKKMKEIEILKNELKWCKLELDNKQEVYNKIFACETKPMIPMIHKERRRKFANSINHREAKSNKIISKPI